MVGDAASIPEGDHISRLHAAAVAALTAYAPIDPTQRQLRADYLAHLAAHPDGMLKAGPPAHLTASCVVLDAAAERVLLTLHGRAHRWFQFGGHLEPGDAGLHAAATREGREESGIELVTPLPSIVQLDRHTLVGDFGHCREHLDVRYVAVLPEAMAPQVSSESHDVRWWPVDQLPEGPTSEVAGLVAAALRMVEDLRLS